MPHKGCETQGPGMSMQLYVEGKTVAEQTQLVKGYEVEENSKGKIGGGA